MSDISIRTIVTDADGRVLSDVTQQIKVAPTLPSFPNWTPSWTVTSDAVTTWSDNKVSITAPAPVKRGPGRPRKDGLPPQPKQQQVKRKPGRPPKNPEV